MPSDWPQNKRPSFLSIMEDLAKFGHSHVSVAHLHLQSSAIQLPVGAYCLMLPCRRSAPSVQKGIIQGGYETASLLPMMELKLLLPLFIDSNQ